MRVIKPTIELLAGIPSVVFGFIGVMVLAPLIRAHLGGPGLSVLAAAIVLGIMVLPTVISISTDAIAAVPQTYREGALALGATRWQAVHMVVLKAARSGIVASIILAMGRAVGETMAVIMVAGQCRESAAFAFGLGADADGQHRAGDGIRHRHAPSRRCSPRASCCLWSS